MHLFMKWLFIQVKIIMLHKKGTFEDYSSGIPFSSVEVAQDNG